MEDISKEEWAEKHLSHCKEFVGTDRRIDKKKKLFRVYDLLINESSLTLQERETFDMLKSQLFKEWFSF